MGALVAMECAWVSVMEHRSTLAALAADQYWTRSGPFVVVRRLRLDREFVDEGR